MVRSIWSSTVLASLTHSSALSLYSSGVDMIGVPACLYEIVVHSATLPCIGTEELRSGMGGAMATTAHSSVGELHAGIDGQAGSIEAGRVLVFLVEQVVDPAEGLDVLVDLARLTTV